MFKENRARPHDLVALQRSARGSPIAGNSSDHRALKWRE
jgi:hypothetical protein